MAKSEREWDLVAMAVADRVRSLRAQLGISQEALARRADVSNQTVYRIEAGHWSPASLEKVSQGLGVPVFQLLEGLDFRSAPQAGGADRQPWVARDLNSEPTGRKSVALQIVREREKAA